MPNFVDDLTALNYPKLALRDAPAGSPRYLRASDWNTLCQAVIDTRDAIIALRTGGGATPTFHGVRAIPSWTSITNNVWTFQEFTSTETFDTDGYHSVVSNSHRITIPAGLAGYYLISAALTFGGWPRTGVLIGLNNTVSAAATTISENSKSNQTINHTDETHVVYYLNVGDYVTCSAFQNSGLAQTTTSLGETGTSTGYFSATLLGT